MTTKKLQKKALRDGQKLGKIVKGMKLKCPVMFIEQHLRIMKEAALPEDSKIVS